MMLYHSVPSVLVPYNIWLQPCDRSLRRLRMLPLVAQKLSEVSAPHKLYSKAPRALKPWEKR